MTDYLLPTHTGAAFKDSRAGCRDFPISWFYPAHGNSRGRTLKLAINVCESCPIQQECLDHALEHSEPFGIWGGKTVRERETLLGRRITRGYSGV